MKNNASLVYSIALVLGDAIAIIAAFTLAYILRVSISHVPITAHVHALTYISILTSLLPFWILIFALIGLYAQRVYDNRFSEISRLFIGAFIGILFVISYAYVTDTTIFPARRVTIYAWLLAFAFLLVVRSLNRIGRRSLFRYGVGISNVLLVGDTRSTSELIESLSATDQTGFKVVGVVRGEHDTSHAHYRHFSTFPGAVEGLHDTPLHIIIQTELYADNDQNDEILTYAQEHHIAYRFVPGNSELFVGKIDVGLFHSVPIIAVHQTALIGWGRVVKRLTDLFLGSIMLIIASPFMLIIAIAIKLFMPGPVFFRQVRLTRFNHEFNVYKFRSNNMTYNGLSPEEAFEKMGRPELAVRYRANGDFLEDDPRIPPLGRFLRKFSLDELPQLFNVIKGDISLVGPRALIPKELALYRKRHTILSVKSGLTGLAQVSGRRDISFEERRTLDVYYVQNWTFWGDMVILARTCWIVLFHRGAV